MCCGVWDVLCESQQVGTACVEGLPQELGLVQWIYMSECISVLHYKDLRRYSDIIQSIHSMQAPCDMRQGLSGSTNKMHGACMNCTHGMDSLLYFRCLLELLC